MKTRAKRAKQERPNSIINEKIERERERERQRETERGKKKRDTSKSEICNH